MLSVFLPSINCCNFVFITFGSLFSKEVTFILNLSYFVRKSFWLWIVKFITNPGLPHRSLVAFSKSFEPQIPELRSNLYVPRLSLRPHPVSVWVLWDADTKKVLGVQEIYWRKCLWKMKGWRSGKKQSDTVWALWEKRGEREEDWAVKTSDFSTALTNPQGVPE